MKDIAIFGSTGSIGRNALDVVKHFPDQFRITALTTNSNIALLEKQIRRFCPLFAGVSDTKAAASLEKKKLYGTKIFSGEEGLAALAAEKKIDKVLLAISGAAALRPLLSAIENNKDIALANKEALVMAGPLVMRLAGKKKAKIIPVDSEQSAIWQCLEGADLKDLKNIYLTASGGPFRDVKKHDFKGISVGQVLKHPRWKMGRKITVDSATLANKGLELLEAMFLFNVAREKIKVLIHPEAVIHSMVEFVDGVVLAQLSATDMRIPIQYALSYPERLENALPRLDFPKLKALHFHAPDFEKFPCLKLAFQVARDLGTAPAVFNAANEIAVEEFLKNKLNFISIPRVIEKVLSRHALKTNPGLNDIWQADIWARNEASKICLRS